MRELRGLVLAALTFLVVTSMAQAEGLEGRTWVAERIKGQAVGAAVRSTFTIASGKVTGSAGCNRLMGSVSVAGGSIAFTGVATTRMACAEAAMAQERAFLEVLAAARTFRMDGGVLTLRDAAGTEVARLKEQS
jgi:heat shock protein HslJ